MTTTTSRTVEPTVGAFCRQLVERADALGYRGKRADGFALDSFIAAIHAFTLAGDERKADLFRCMTVLIITTRGMAEVRLLASRPDTPTSEA